ncbi:MAG TPA: cytochrome c3 family protein, partial [Dokdonella sp.]|nr:cytochrome c3 family protein [Dokdonella sp.]
MRWLIRRVLKKGKSSISYEDDIHFGDILTIGRAADQAIFLPDLRAALNHASITAIGRDKYRIESLIVAGIRVNGEITYAATVGAGAIIELGSTRLTLLDARGDFDAAVEVASIDKSEQAEIVSSRKKPTSLSQTWISKRWPSWLGFILVLAFGLLLPAATHVVPGLNTILHYSPFPSTAFWNPGEIDSAHQFFAKDCTRCHQQAFLMVRDKACTSCHVKTKAHADPALFNIPELGDARCGSCHQDHNGKRGMVSTDQRLCASCHADLKDRSKGASQLVDISDFGTAHPQFHVSLPGWDARDEFTPKSMPWSNALKENSGLKFNHLKHLDRDGLKTPDGLKILTCASCHQPDVSAAAMKPIAFETMCHDCHTLG